MTPLDDVEFLARSPHRVAVLRTLHDGPTTRSALHAATDIPQPTLGRILGDFEDRHWAARDGREYALTSAGRLVAEGFTDLLGTAESVQHLGPLVRQLPADALSFDLRELGDATVMLPDTGDAFRHIRRMEERYFTAEHSRFLGATIGTISSTERVEQAHAFRESDREAETIVPASMVELAMADPELRAFARDALPEGRATAYIYDGHIPFVLVVADGTTMLAPTDDRGFPTGLIETTNPVVHEWAEATLDDYRDRAVRMTPDDLPE